MKRPVAILGFPYRATPERARIFELVEPLVRGMYDWDTVITRDSGHQTFNRAASRNMIAEYAMTVNVEVVVICDADSIPDPEILGETIDSVALHGGLRIPFDNVRVLPYNRFLRTPEKYATIKPRNEYGPSCGGIYILRPYLWKTLGGMDERIEGWGFEDQIFLSAVNTFDSGPIYHVGDLYNIDHPREKSVPEVAQNRALVDKYHAVEGKRDEFKLLQVGSNDFRPDKGSK
jgi:hypothetical protein